MPLTHIEHPEDTILTGDLSVLDAFLSPNDYSAVSYTHLTLPTIPGV